MIRNVTCIDLSERADGKARSLLSKEGFERMGFRLSKAGNEIIFKPLQELKTKDYVLQPRTVVVFIDPKSYKDLYGTDIDFENDNWVFNKSNRKLIEREKIVKKPKTKKN